MISLLLQKQIDYLKNNSNDKNVNYPIEGTDNSHNPRIV